MNICTNGGEHPLLHFDFSACGSVLLLSNQRTVSQSVRKSVFYQGTVKQAPSLVRLFVRSAVVAFSREPK